MSNREHKEIQGGSQVTGESHYYFDERVDGLFLTIIRLKNLSDKICGVENDKLSVKSAPDQPKHFSLREYLRETGPGRVDNASDRISTIIDEIQQALF